MKHRSMVFLLLTMVSDFKYENSGWYDGWELPTSELNNA